MLRVQLLFTYILSARNRSKDLRSFQLVLLHIFAHNAQNLKSVLLHSFRTEIRYRFQSYRCIRQQIHNTHQCLLLHDHISRHIHFARLCRSPFRQSTIKFRMQNIRRNFYFHLSWIAASAFFPFFFLLRSLGGRTGRSSFPFEIQHHFRLPFQIIRYRKFLRPHRIQQRLFNP